MLVILVFAAGGFWGLYSLRSMRISPIRRGLVGISLGIAVGLMIAVSIGAGTAKRNYIQHTVLEELCGFQKLLVVIGKDNMGSYLFSEKGMGPRFIAKRAVMAVVETDQARGYFDEYTDVLPPYYWLFAISVNNGYELRVPRGTTIHIQNHQERTRLTAVP